MLRMFREIYEEMEPNQRLAIQALYVIQPTLYLRTRMMVANKCAGEEIKKVFDIIYTFKK